MMQELKPGQNGPDQGELPGAGLSLEILFSTGNAAKVVTYEPGDDLDENPTIGRYALADRFSGVFSSTGVPHKRKRGNQDWSKEYQDRLEEWHSYARIGDSEGMMRFREETAHFMAEIIFSPPLDLEKTRLRGELIGRLSGLGCLEELVKLKDGTWRVLEGLGHLNLPLGNSRSESIRLIEDYWAGTEYVPILDDPYNYYSEEIGKENVMARVLEAAEKINLGFECLDKLGKRLAATGDSLIVQQFSGMAAEAARIRQEVAELIPVDKRPSVSGCGSWEDKGDELESLIKRIKPYFLSLSAAIEFAGKVRNEGWQRITADAAKPPGYTQGWNLGEAKDGQVLNDSPGEASITILSGANASGKTFYMISDFFIKMVGQSIGFAPVSSANLLPVDGLVFLDRPTTDPEHNLSAFMREVANWRTALEGVGPRTRLYADEGYSTTSPEDQAKLLSATAQYIRERGGSVMLATHNDVLLETGKKHPDVGIYNLQTEMGENGELRYFHKLQPGQGDALSLEVAEARKFSPTMIADAREYRQKGKIETGTLPDINYPEPVTYTPEQREQEKREISTLARLFPEKPEDPLFHQLSLDREFDPHTLMRELTSSGDKATRGTGGDRDFGDLMGRMILWQPVPLPGETAERQMMFGELVRNKNYDILLSRAERVRLLEETAAEVGKHAKGGVNNGLNPVRFSDEESAIKAGDIECRFNPRKLGRLIKAIDAYLSIQTILFPELTELTELRKRYAAFGEVNTDLAERWKPGEECGLTSGERERVKAVTGDNTTGTEEVLNGNDLQKAVIKTTAVLREMSDGLPAVGIKDLPTALITEKLTVLEAFRRNTEMRKKGGDVGEETELREMEVWDIRSGGLALAVRILPEMVEEARLLEGELKSMDSVYLHQAANVIREQLNHVEAAIVGTAEAGEKEKMRDAISSEVTISPLNHLGRGVSPMRPDESTTPYKQVLMQIAAVAGFAQIIDEQGLAKVGFNDTGEIRLEKAFSLFKSRKAETANDIVLSPESTRVQLLTGPHGSGKTFYEKSAAAGVMMAMATGYAPAEEATIPMLDAVVYMDRVSGKPKDKQSAFTQELEYWKELLRIMSSRKAALVVVDEAWSATSPGYQAALTAAATVRVLRSSHLMMLSTHNHDAISGLTEGDTPHTKPYHFGFEIIGGRIRYKYELSEGHQKSHAIEVARTVGLPEEILALANKQS